MNKFIIFAAICCFVTSCASSNKVASNSHALAQREIASTSKVPECALESHPRNKSWYRVSVSGNPYNNHWYSKKDAMNIRNKVASSGRCW